MTDDRPIRVQLSRKKGWRMPENTVNVARPGRWGNPHVVGESGIPDANAAVLRFRQGLGLVQFGEFGPLPPHPDSPCGRMIRDIEQLRGANLACWCELGQPCHADVLLELANEVRP